MTPDVIRFAPDGTGAGLYTERIDLREIGPLEVVRATGIEFDEATQRWEVRDPSGVLLHSDPSRQACLDWEHRQFSQSSPEPPRQPNLEP